MKNLLNGLFIFAAVFSLSTTVKAQIKKMFNSKVEIAGGKEVFKSGETIPLKITTEYPDYYQLTGWRVIGYVHALPANFAKITKQKVVADKDPKWSAIHLKFWTWLPIEKRSGKEIDGKFSTKGFPPGDYQLNVTVLFQGKNKAEKHKDVYNSASFIFTLE